MQRVDAAGGGGVGGRGGGTEVTSDSRNGELSDLVPVYSPGRSRKKKAMMIMSAIA